MTRPSDTASKSRIGDLDSLHEHQRDPEEAIHASEWADEKGVHRPIKDGLENDGVGELSDDDSELPDLTGDTESETSEEERGSQKASARSGLVGRRQIATAASQGPEQGVRGWGGPALSGTLEDQGPKTPT